MIILMMLKSWVYTPKYKILKDFSNQMVTIAGFSLILPGHDNVALAIVNPIRKATSKYMSKKDVNKLIAFVNDTLSISSDHSYFIV